MQATFNAKKNIILPHRLREVFLEENMINKTTEQMLIGDREDNKLVIDLTRAPAGVLNRSEIDEVAPSHQSEAVRAFFEPAIPQRTKVALSTNLSSLFEGGPTRRNDEPEFEFDSGQLDKLWEEDDTFIKPISLENPETVEKPISRVRQFGRKMINLAKRSTILKPQTKHERRVIRAAATAIVGGIALLGIAGGISQNNTDSAPETITPIATDFDISDYEVEITSSAEEQMTALHSPEFRAMVERPNEFELMMNWVEANPDKDLNAYFQALEQNA
jgi:hypothetical protein